MTTRDERRADSPAHNPPRTFMAEGNEASIAHDSHGRAIRNGTVSAGVSEGRVMDALGAIQSQLSSLPSISAAIATLTSRVDTIERKIVEGNESASDGVEEDAQKSLSEASVKEIAAISHTNKAGSKLARGTVAVTVLGFCEKSER